MKTATAKLWTGKTARQELVLMASIKLKLHRHWGWSVHAAIEDCIDNWQASDSGTMRHEMGQYVHGGRGLSGAAYHRLCAEIVRNAAS
jgi:hypothetical protein